MWNAVGSRQKLLFFDWRDMACGHLQWTAPDGRAYGVATPSDDPDTPLHAVVNQVPHGVRLVAQPAHKTDPIGDWQGWGRVIYDDDRAMYRSWYLRINGHAKLGTGSSAHARPPECVEVCSVESADGFSWSQPKAGRIEVRGQIGFDGQTFFIDPVAPPDQRYKMIYCAAVDAALVKDELAAYLKRPARLRDYRIRPDRVYAIWAAASPDGLQWKALPRPLMLHPSDTDTTVGWDPDIEQYVIYTRMMRSDRRWIGRAATSDLFDWPPIEPVLWPSLNERPDLDLYLNGYSRYPGAPDYHLMFPMVYERYTERSDVRLCSSEDGIVWNRVPGGPVIEPGPAGAWDSEFLGSGKDLVPFGPGRIATPYSGTMYPHKYPRSEKVWQAWQTAWAWWPQDRLCALRADRAGSFCTLPFVPAGRQVRLNVCTMTGGVVRVGVVGVDGRQVAECDPIVGDHDGVTVTWRGSPDLGDAGQSPIALQFELQSADLFAVSFA